MRFTAFSQWESFHEYMHEHEGQEQPDLVIAEPEFLNPWLESMGESPGVPWLLLSEGHEEVEEDKRLMKYQPLPALLDTVLNASRQPRRKRYTVQGSNPFPLEWCQLREEAARQLCHCIWPSSSV